MSKLLILCFDGTWNQPGVGFDQTQTNVSRLWQALASKSPHDLEQRTYYESGVGTNWWERYRGGAFGLGIDRHIKEGYQWLVREYADSDCIYLFGFSRGAYTARSLAGLIRNAGLLRQDVVQRRALQRASRREFQQRFDDALSDLTDQAYELYRLRDESADTQRAVAFRHQCAKEVDIAFIGVWDTVGVLGIPFLSSIWFDKARYEFHDTQLSGMVKRAYHAVAIDEHRQDYNVTLWTNDAKPGQIVEQRWFAGAHADVGGGYEDPRLSLLTLRWMLQQAKAAGLGFLNELEATQLADNHTAPLTDSYHQFLGGLYAKIHDPFYRVMSATGTNEVLDDSARQRLQIDVEYRPQNPGFDALCQSGEPPHRGETM